ncbi:MAG: metallophosphoesterase family protein [Zestosphaera sp.]
MSVNTVWDYIKGSLDTLLSDYSRIRDFIRNSLSSVILSELKKFEGPMVTKESGKIFFIIGDIHGDLETLRKILTKLNVNLVKEGSVELVFLGDYVDRGSHQLECLLTALLLKNEFPDSVTLLRGNHEPPPHLIPLPHDFPQTLKLTYGYVKGTEIYQDFMELFNNMSLVLYVRDSFIALHGGLPTLNYNSEVTLREYFLGNNADERTKLIEEILWNDPVDLNIGRSPSPRGAGYLFGTLVTQWVLRKFRVRLIVRGHEPSYEGFKLNHKKRVVTLFSRVGEPYYNRYASYMSLDTTTSMCFEEPVQCINRIGY